MNKYNEGGKSATPIVNAAEQEEAEADSEAPLIVRWKKPGKNEEQQSQHSQPRDDQSIQRRTDEAHQIH